MSSNELRALRAATVADAPAIAAVHVRGWRWAYREQLPSSLLASLSAADREQMWKGALEAPPESGIGVWVAQEQDAVVGFAAAGPARDEPPGSLVGELYALYLEERVAGTGAGRALLDAAMAALAGRGFRQAVLWVLETNARARAFYERNQWSADGASKTELVGDTALREVRYRRALSS